MTSTCLGDTLPLTLEDSDEEILESSDGERTNYESDISFSDKSKSGSSVKIL